MTYETETFNRNSQPDVINLCLKKDTSLYPSSSPLHPLHHQHPLSGAPSVGAGSGPQSSSIITDTWRTFKLDDINFNFDNNLCYNDILSNDDNGCINEESDCLSDCETTAAGTMSYFVRNEQPSTSSAQGHTDATTYQNSDCEDNNDLNENKKFKLSQRSFMKMIRQKEAQLEAAAAAQKHSSKNKKGAKGLTSATTGIDHLHHNNNNNNNNSSSNYNSHANNNNNHNNTGFHLSLYGWRKKCLFVLILVLLIMIIINLALTLWILKVMEFSSEGMGQFKVVTGGLQLTGQALVLDVLRASTIRSRHGQPISIESSRNFSVNTRDSEGFIENQLFLGHEKLEFIAKSFQVTDPHGGNLFSVDRDEVTIGANALKVDGEGGAIFKESIQTPLVRAEAGKDLKLESPTRSLEVRASHEIFIQSQAGGIDATCLNDLKLHSVAGNIRLDSANIIIPNLKTAQPPQPGQAQSRDHVHKVYQLCVCGTGGANNGKLFLASPHSICAADDNSVCR